MAFDAIGHRHDVELGGQGLLLTAGTYSVYSITPFAPQIAVENPSHSTLSAWTSFTIDDWSHGFGFVNQVDIQGYGFASGNIDTRTAHLFQLFSALNSSSTPAQPINIFQDFSSNLYAGLNAVASLTTLWRHNGTSWAAAPAGVGADGSATGRPNVAIQDLLSAQDSSGNAKLFIALGQTQDFQTFDGTAYATPVAGKKFNLFALAGGYMWAADNTNQVFYASSPTTSWSAAVKVGNSVTVITALAEFNNRLYVGTNRGLFFVEPGSDYAYPAVVFNDEINANNCVGMRVWRGFLYFSILNKLYRLHPSNAVSDVSPGHTLENTTDGRYTTLYPYRMMANFRAFTPGRTFLYYVAEDSRSTSSQQTLMAFDGVGHHMLATILTTTGSLTVSRRGMVFSQIASNPRLFVATNESTGKNYYANIQNYSELPYADFPTTGTHYLETSRMHFNMPEIIKCFRDAILNVDNGSSTQTVLIEFALENNNTYHTLGTANATAWRQAFTFNRVDGTAESATSTTLTDSVNITQAANYWADATVDITSGTGAGQSRTITASTSGGQLTVGTAWTTTPDSTSVYQITWQAYVIRFRLTLSTASGSNSPVVEAFTLRFIARPERRLGWRFQAKLADRPETNLGTISGDTLAENLRTLALNWRDVKAPVRFKDKDSTAYNVLVTDATLVETAYNPRDELGQGRVEYAVNFTLAEI